MFGIHAVQHPCRQHVNDHASRERVKFVGASQAAPCSLQCLCPYAVPPADWAPLQMGAEERENACAQRAAQGPRLDLRELPHVSHG